MVSTLIRLKGALPRDGDVFDIGMLTLGSVGRDPLS